MLDTMTGKKLHYLRVYPNVYLRNKTKITKKAGGLFVFVLRMEIQFIRRDPDGDELVYYEYEVESPLETVSRETKAIEITDTLLKNAGEYFKKTSIYYEIMSDLEDRKGRIIERVQHYIDSIVIEPIQVWDKYYNYHTCETLLWEGLRENSNSIILEIHLNYLPLFCNRQQTSGGVVVKHEVYYFMQAMAAWLCTLEEYTQIVWERLLEQVYELFQEKPNTLEKVEKHLFENREYILKTIRFFLGEKLYNKQEEYEKDGYF